MGSDIAIRRSRFLVTYWDGGTHLAYNYLTRTRHPCSAVAVAVLDAANHWTDRASIRRLVPEWPDTVIADVIDELVRDGTLDSADRPPTAKEEALREWAGWNPTAGYFHAATSAGIEKHDDSGHRGPPLLVERDFPPVLKQYPGQPTVELPACSREGQLAEVLWRRRTWREFDGRRLTLGEISTLLGLTFGVERWIEAAANHWVALKSSPSGGARHSVEAYLFAFDVEGLDRATYHYCPDTHALSRLATPASRDLLATFVPAQPGFHDPAAFIVMTSVFARVQWKYQRPHAYRVVLLDAGHLSQTFALVATSLGLAPFCTAAVNTERIEQHLGIDGVSESVVLALGVGARPADKAWAPMHDHSASPRTAPPAWAARLPMPAFP